MEEERSSAKRKKRVVLNQKSVCEIQSLAPSFAGIMCRGVKSQMSNELALKFGVDAKTIRDIWNRKSWNNNNNKKKDEAVGTFNDNENQKNKVTAAVDHQQQHDSSSSSSSSSSNNNNNSSSSVSSDTFLFVMDPTGLSGGGGGLPSSWSTNRQLSMKNLIQNLDY